MSTTTSPRTEPIAVRNPADGRVVGTVPALTEPEIRTRVTALRAAQPAWEALGPRGRRRWLERYADWLADHATELAELLQSETGKPWQEATFEVPVLLDLIGYYARNAERFLAERHPRNHGLLTVTKTQSLGYRPYPVVGVICPWNFPLILALGDAVPALLAGATVLVKPSEFTPLATRRAIAGWHEIGAPAVFACATGAGATGAALVDAVDYIQFTGSTRTGRRIGQRAAERLVPCGLELGGKDAALVLADADLERAANGIVWGAMFNSGQACISIERVYVEAPVYDDFVERVVAKVRALRQGPDPDHHGSDIGALANAAQLALVDGQVRAALAAGARALTGGRPSPLGGTYFEPTVLVDVDHSMTVMTEETFGPVIPIMRVADTDTAIRLANASPYGLSATVWTGDSRAGRTVARRLEVGAVNVNDAYSNMFCFPLPQAGWKQSGLGARLGGAAGIRKFCRAQAITTARVTPRTELFWYPYTARKARITAAVLRFARLTGRRFRLFR